MNSKEVEKEVTAIDFMKSACDRDSANHYGKAQRKLEGNEWKGLRRTDYQRLETVLEEVHLPCESTTTEQNDDFDETLCENEVNKNTLWLCSPLSKIEYTEQLESDKENERQEEIEEKELLTCSRNDDSDSKINFKEAQEELIDSRGCSKILSGIMELLPIFSNDKFVCSKDAISIQECELDSVEKSLLPSGKPLLEGKNSKGSLVFSDLAKLPNSGQNGFGNRLTEAQCILLEMYERFRCKTLSDMNLMNGSSSHFINFFLVLTQFSAEKKKLFSVNNLSDCGNKCSISKNVLANQIVGESLTNTTASAFQIFCKMILTIFGLMSVVVCVSWKLQKPTYYKCFLFFIPFLQRKPTYFQTFYERTLKIMTNIFGGICI